MTLKRLLVHLKDKRTPHDTAGVVYQIPCKDCTKVYTGETGRRYGIREKEHRKDVDSVEDKRFTRARRKESVEEYHPSALTDHVAQSNHPLIGRGSSFPCLNPNGRSEGSRRQYRSVRQGPTR